MKFNFKKIASVIASTVMLSSTVALAAAANYPAPFVSSGVADVAVVYGASALGTDMIAATDITTNLNSKLVVAGAATTMTGDSFKLAKSTNNFNLDEDLNDIYPTLDDGELSTVLASGVFWSDANEDFDYEQKIDLGGAALGFWQDNDFNDEVPYIGFKLAAGDHILNYTLDFTDAVDCGDFGLVVDTTTTDDCESTDLTMLGRTYYVIKTDSTVNGVELTLLDSANSATITDGETSALTVSGTSYDVGIVFVDSDEVILDVNGEQTNKLKEGDVFKVGTDLYLGVKTVLYNEKESGVSKVEISLGSGKIVLENKQEIQFNGEDISDITDPESIVKAYITNTTTELNKIVLEWNMNDDAWINAGSELLLPGFETIKLSMGSFVEADKEVTSIEADGDTSLKLSTKVADGDVSLNILYANTTGFIGLGKDSDSLLATSATNALTFDSDDVEWFVASILDGDEAESYVLRVKSIDDGTDGLKNTTIIESVVTGDQVLELDLAEKDDLGDIPIEFTLTAANEITGVVTLTLTAPATFDKIYTADGMKIQLPVVSVTPSTADGKININGTSSPATFTMNVTEEDEDGDINVGSSLYVGLGLNTNGEAQVASVETLLDYETEDGSNVYEGYLESKLATKTIFDTDGDQDMLDIEYNGVEAYADVFVSEAGAAIVTEGGASILPVPDTESTSAKNLVVVGGSCINTVAATLLGGALCGADFEAATKVGAGSFLIATYAYGTDGVATLVAGYNAGDTTNAAKYLTTQVVDTTVGKKYIGTTATSATLDVE